MKQYFIIQVSLNFKNSFLILFLKLSLSAYHRSERYYFILSFSLLFMTALWCRCYQFIIVQMWDPSLREVKELTRSHTADEWTNQGLKLISFVYCQGWRSELQLRVRTTSMAITMQTVEAHSQGFGWVTPSVGPKNLISNKLPGDTDTASHRTRHWESLA